MSRSRKAVAVAAVIAALSVGPFVGIAYGTVFVFVAGVVAGVLRVGGDDVFLGSGDRLRGVLVRALRGLGRVMHLFGRRRRPVETRTVEMWSSVGSWVDRLVGWLVEGALRRLAVGLRDRYAEEWADHRSRLHGWRLVWWALWLRATAARTGREYQRARLPYSGGS